jgi:hypothetical protein
LLLSGGGGTTCGVEVRGRDGGAGIRGSRNGGSGRCGCSAQAGEFFVARGGGFLGGGEFGFRIR